jgi:hypothetical protein
MFLIEPIHVPKDHIQEENSETQESYELEYVFGGLIQKKLNKSAFRKWLKRK